MTARGSLALLLHAHLPFVRHAERENACEERWFFEAITESYIPLLRMLQQLHADRIPAKLTLSLSPTLSAMMTDGLLRERYLRHLDALIELCDGECQRNKRNRELLSLSQWYRQLFAETRRIFAEEWKCDLLFVIRELRVKGALELIANTATHAILPILQQTPLAARAQVAIGCDFFRETFGVDPAGFWLPECAYAPAVDELLQKENIRWFAVDAHALEFAQPVARAGTFAPCFTPAGPAAFARDTEASRQIWHAQSGYPGDAAYRDFYRDIGFDLAAEQLASMRCAHGQFTGVKYHRVTGGDDPKEVYVPAAAEETARRHARHFIEQCIAALARAEVAEPILFAPFDAELFGHWWFEGPVFLEEAIRLAAENHLPLITPTDFLRKNPPLQIVQPAVSSWGDGGYLDVWLDDKCGWIFPQLFSATQRMSALANAHAAQASPEQERALSRLACELLLVQASDWPFHIRNGTAAEYAADRVRDHLARFGRLATSLERGKLETDLLARKDADDNLFPKISWRHYCHPEQNTASPMAGCRIRSQ